MRPFDRAELQRSMINCTRSEAASIAVPTDFGHWPWDDRDFAGWRDPKAPLRGYLVRRLTDGTLQGVSLRAASGSMSRAVKAMCLVCRSTHSGDQVSLFTARRVGAAGRAGNTVGTYLCADLGCAGVVGGPGDAVRDRAEGALPPEERAARIRSRLDAFVADVLRP
jgi:hypothetical protein